MQIDGDARASPFVVFFCFQRRRTNEAHAQASFLLHCNVSEAESGLNSRLRYSTDSQSMSAIWYVSRRRRLVRL